MSVLGPLMVSIEGERLSQDDKAVLSHPWVGGLILFRRNFASLDQLQALVQECRTLRNPRLLVAVDHEGGRVQRFCEPLTRLPDMQMLGEYADRSPKKALTLAETCGWVMGCELLALGIDLSFAPVVDVGGTNNPALRGRCFHSDPEWVVRLAKALTIGMHKAGMATVGKHFPGHGGVSVDSHVDTPRDERDFKTIASIDLLPYKTLCADLDAVMTAHVIYPQVDPSPATYAEAWLKSILRQKIGFKGVIFSDDLNMAGAGSTELYRRRVQRALNAGCDIALLCNNRVAVQEILACRLDANTETSQAIASLYGDAALSWDALLANKNYHDARQTVCDFVASGVV